MSGLVLKLAPGETFIVNGALLENGDRPSRIRIRDNDARVLRCSDAMKPEEVSTPCQQVYYAIQLLITGDLAIDAAVPAILDECAKLEDVFETIDATLLPTLSSMVKRGNFYSALCHLRQIIALEADLFAYADRKVA